MILSTMNFRKSLWVTVLFVYMRVTGSIFFFFFENYYDVWAYIWFGMETFTT
jgi:hypothetical protein